MIDESKMIALLFEQRQKEKAFEQVLMHYQKPVYYYIRKFLVDHDDTDDVCQQVFIKAWKGLGNFKGESKIGTWLYRIAYNESMTFIEKKKRIAGVALDKVESELPGVLMSDDLFTGDEIQAKLQSAVAALPDKQRAVFIMKYFEDRRYEDIAEITGTSVGALKASFHHAVHKIELFMKNNTTW